MTELGFDNAKFVTDQWHLFDSGLSKLFGKVGYELLICHLIKMIPSESKSKFQEIMRAGEELLHFQPQRNGQMESDLVKVVALRETYASHCLAKIPGNRGLCIRNIASGIFYTTYLCAGNIIVCHSFYPTHSFYNVVPILRWHTFSMVYKILHSVSITNLLHIQTRILVISGYCF